MTDRLSRSSVPEPSLPVVIGACHYCGDQLYAGGPTTLLDEPLSHVACAVHARRAGTRA